MAEEQDEIFIEENAASLDDSTESLIEDTSASNIIPFVMERYTRADKYREQDEQRWLRSYRNYRGLYSSDVQFTEAEKSRVFVKVTKTKTLAAYGQIVDVLFAANKFPLTIEPTKLPEGVIPDVHFDPKEPQELKDKPDASPYGFAGDGKEIPAGSTATSLMENLGPLAGKFDDIEGLKEGTGKTPTAITFSPAMIAAKGMEKKIHDQ